MKIFNYIIITLFFFISCNSENNKEKIEELKNKETLDVEAKEKQTQSIIDGLVSKYNIIYLLDTVKYGYSIDYKPIIETNYQLIKKFVIKDIFQKDSNYYITIQPLGGLIKDLIMPIKKEQLKLFIDGRRTNILIVSNNILVVSLKEVKKIDFSFKGVHQDQETADLGLENSLFFLSKGELIEIVPIKR